MIDVPNSCLQRTALRAAAERQVVGRHPVEHGASVSLRTSSSVDLAILKRRIADSLERAGVPDPEVDIERVEVFERQTSGKLRRFFPLPMS